MLLKILNWPIKTDFSDYSCRFGFSSNMMRTVLCTERQALCQALNWDLVSVSCSPVMFNTGHSSLCNCSTVSGAPRLPSTSRAISAAFLRAFWTALLADCDLSNNIICNVNFTYFSSPSDWWNIDQPNPVQPKIRLVYWVGLYFINQTG